MRTRCGESCEEHNLQFIYALWNDLSLLLLKKRNRILQKSLEITTTSYVSVGVILEDY